MKSVNMVILLGNVTKDPEVRIVQIKNENVKVARFSVATSVGGYTRKDGTEVPEETQFHRITAWRGLAEVVEQIVHKGDGVHIEGSLKYSEVEKDGHKDHFTEIVADEVILCNAKDKQVSPQPFQAPQYPPQYQPQQPSYPPPYQPQYPPQYQQPIYPTGQPPH